MIYPVSTTSDYSCVEEGYSYPSNIYEDCEDEQREIKNLEYEVEELESEKESLENDVVDLEKEVRDLEHKISFNCNY